MINRRDLLEMTDKERRQFRADVNQINADELARQRRRKAMTARQRIKHDDTYEQGEDND